MPITGMRMSPIGSPSAGSCVRGAVTGGPVGSLSRADSSARARRIGVAVGLLLELGAQPGLGVGLLDGGAPDLVGREEEQQDADPDEDPPEDVDDPSKCRHRRTEIRAARGARHPFARP